jgi:hypothetical protein
VTSPAAFAKTSFIRKFAPPRASSAFPLFIARAPAYRTVEHERTPSLRSEWRPCRLGAR